MFLIASDTVQTLGKKLLPLPDVVDELLSTCVGKGGTRSEARRLSGSISAAAAKRWKRGLLPCLLLPFFLSSQLSSPMS